MAIGLRNPFYTRKARQNGAVPEAKAIPPRSRLVPVDFIAWNTPGGGYREINLRDPVSPGGLSLGSIYVASAYVYVAMRWRAMKYAEAPLIVQRELPPPEEGREWLRDHELQALFDDPAPDYDMGELLRLTRLYRDLWGSCLWLKERNAAGGIARLTPYAGDEFSIVEDPTNEFIYRGYRLAGSPGVIDRTEAVLFREMNPYSWDVGIGPAQVAAHSSAVAETAFDAIGEVLDNAVFPSIVIQTDKDWDPDDDEWNVYVDQIKRHAQAERKGEPLVLVGGGTVTVPGMNMRQLMPADVLDEVQATVASVFGVPPVVLGFAFGWKNSPWSNTKEADRYAIVNTIEPMWVADQTTLDRQLLHAPVRPGGAPLDADPATHVHFDRSEIRGLEPDREREANIAAQLRDVLTVNERRMLVGKDPLPEGDERGEVIVGLQTAEPAGAEE